VSALEVMAATGLATVQDAGRPGFMHQGVPPGGALVPELLGAANAAVSNARDAAAVEVFGEITLSARGTVELACDGGERRALRDGESWTVRSGKARVAYVAVRGGLGVPRVLGGRGTLLVAGLGGHEGHAAPVDGVAGVPLDLSGPIRLVLGPDAFPDGGLEALLASPFVVDARSDRTGVRLVGPAIAAPPRDDAAPSAPMARGAIQVPPSGQPIILGPDHPTTGGYPVIAVVVSADFGRLAARPIGSTVRFVACL
jgi:5-oxoprolinase (ATP-hydrolysing) subunit C